MALVVLFARTLCLVIVTLALGAPMAPRPAKAVEPDEILEDPALEARARDISRELRCLVCRNESIDESNADLARDLRLFVRDRLVAGKTDAEVIAEVRDRYGDYVLLKPPLSPATVTLWLAPLAVLVLGGLLAVAVFRRHGRALAAEEP